MFMGELSRRDSEGVETSLSPVIGDSANASLSIHQ